MMRFELLVVVALLGLLALAFDPADKFRFAPESEVPTPAEPCPLTRSAGGSASAEEILNRLKAVTTKQKANISLDMFIIFW
jgi:hypothetical protein